MGNFESWMLFILFGSSVGLVCWNLHLHKGLTLLQDAIVRGSETCERFQRAIDANTSEIYRVESSLPTVVPNILEQVYGTRKPHRRRATPKVLANGHSEAIGIPEKDVREGASIDERSDAGGKKDIPEGER